MATMTATGRWTERLEGLRADCALLGRRECLAVLAALARAEGGRLNGEELAAATGLGQDAVDAAVRRLEVAGLIRCTSFVDRAVWSANWPELHYLGTAIVLAAE